MSRGNDLASPAGSPAWPRIGWTLASVSNLLVGVFFAVGALTAASSPLGKAAWVTSGLLLVVLSVFGFDTRVLRPSRSAAARRVCLGDAEVVVRLRWLPRLCGLLMLVLVAALLVEGSAAAYAAGLVVLGSVAAVLAAPAIVLAANSLLAVRGRHAMRMSAETLTLSLGPDDLTLDWGQIAAVEREVRVTYSRGIAIRNAFIRVDLVADAAVVIRPRGFFRIPRRRPISRLLLTECFLDRPACVRELVESLARLDEPGRRVVLANPTTVAYLTGDLETSPLPSS